MRIECVVWPLEIFSNVSRSLKSLRTQIRSQRQFVAQHIKLRKPIPYVSRHSQPQIGMTVAFKESIFEISPRKTLSLTNCTIREIKCHEHSKAVERQSENWLWFRPKPSLESWFMCNPYMNERACGKRAVMENTVCAMIARMNYHLLSDFKCVYLCTRMESKN